MQAIDTNVVARYLLGDDPHQYAIATSVMGQGVFLPTTVLLELGWLLMSRYRLSREVSAKALAEFVDLPTVTVEDESSIRWALERFGAGADLPDMVHLISSRLAESFATFDADIAAKAGPNSPVKIQTLS